MMISNYLFNTQESNQFNGENDDDSNIIGAHIWSFLIENSCRMKFVLKTLYALYCLAVKKSPEVDTVFIPLALEETEAWRDSVSFPKSYTSLKTQVSKSSWLWKRTFLMLIALLF